MHKQLRLNFPNLESYSGAKRFLKLFLNSFTSDPAKVNLMHKLKYLSFLILYYMK